MAFYYTKNDTIVASALNRTFADLYTCDEADFEAWADSLCNEVARLWDEEDQPPKTGVRLEDMGAEFERICNVDVSKMWFKDEQSRDLNCVIDSSRIPVANNFFPNIHKAKDTIGLDKAVSIYETYTKKSVRPKTIEILKVCIRKDGFHTFTKVYRVGDDFKGDLRREARCFVDAMLKQENEGISESSFLIEPAQKIERKTPRLSMKEVREYVSNGRFLRKHLNDLDLSEFSSDAFFRIRTYETGSKAKKVLPTAFRCLELSGISAPNNFPAAIARLLYSYATDRIKDQDEIVIYDPSMGFGGRLLGALSLRDRQVHYIGTDPNTENWIKELGISRYEYMERVFKSHVRYGKPFRGTYLCCGSEEIADNEEFLKYKGNVDFIFTSPPYFSAEIYCDEPTQSSARYKEYGTWRDNFLRPTLRTCADWLKRDRILAFNIADVNVSGKQFPLEQDLVEILKECGLQYQGKLKMVIARSPAMQIKKFTGQPSTKNFCIVNGRWRKYEPIFVFYKQ